jgi:hypothetical protein
MVAPPVKDRILFVGRKKFASLNNLVVCDHRGLFTYAAVGIRGPRNDKHLYNISSLKQNIESGKWLSGEKEIFGNGYEYPEMLLADSGFVLRPFMLHPYVKPKGA